MKQRSESFSEAGAGVRLERTDRVASLIIDRPPLNVLDAPTLANLSQELAALGQSNDLQVLVLRGSERSFSAGVAVEDHTRDKIANSLRLFHGVLRSVAGLPAISIAVIRGHCLGGGMELAAACDFILADRGSHFGQPEIGLGCFPPAAAAIYPERLGHSATLDLLATGRTLDAHEAHGLGFVTWLADPESIEDLLTDKIGEICNKSAAVTRALKKTLHQGRQGQFEDALERTERAYLDELLPTEDMDEGITAFFEKRSPAWKHK